MPGVTSLPLPDLEARVSIEALVRLLARQAACEFAEREADTLLSTPPDKKRSEQ